MKRLETTLLDIYEAAGCEITEDRTMVKLNSGQQLKPFDIRLTVQPSVITIRDGEPEMITLSVLLPGDYIISDDRKVRIYEYSEALELPVRQVNIIKE